MAPFDEELHPGFMNRSVWALTRRMRLGCMCEPGCDGRCVTRLLPLQIGKSAESAAAPVGPKSQLSTTTANCIEIPRRIGSPPVPDLKIIAD